MDCTMFRRKIIFTLLLSTGLCLPTFAMFAGDDEGVSIPQRRKGFKPPKEPPIPESAFVLPVRTLKLDQRRQLFYFGVSLEDLPPLATKPKPKNLDDTGAYFETTEQVEEETVSAQSLSKTEDASAAKYGPPSEDKDGRVEVDSPAKYHWRVHGHLEMTFGWNSVYIGSATLIDGKYAITAGHNLFDRDTGRYAKQVVFFPGLKDAVAPWRVESTGFAVHPEYYNLNSVDVMGSDIGVVKFNQTIGTRIGYYGLDVLLDDDRDNKGLNVTGYPGDLPRELPAELRGRRMYTMQGAVEELRETRVLYSIDTWKGQSGSGVWVKRGDEDDDYSVVAVHAYGKWDQDPWNSGTRITPEKFRFIETSMKKMESVLGN